MTILHRSRVKEVASNKPDASTAFNLPDSAATGYQSFDSAYASTNAITYFATNGTDWENGIGTFTAGSPDTLARGLLLESSTGSFINWSSGGDVTVFQASSAKLDELSMMVNESILPGGRLTLTSGTPVTTADVTGATNIYYTPFMSNKMALWNGYFWQPVLFTEYTLALGTLFKSAAYDIFAYLSSGALALEMLEWKNATVTMTIATPGVVTWTAHGSTDGDPISFSTTGALPTGITAGTQYFVINSATDTFQVSATVGGAAINTTGSQSGVHTCHHSRLRDTGISIQDGNYCKTGDKTRLYLGSFYTTATTTTEDSLLKRYLFNYYNRVSKNMIYAAGSSSHTFSTDGSIREYNGTSNVAVLRVFMGLTIDCQLFVSGLFVSSDTNGVSLNALINTAANFNNNALAVPIYGTSQQLPSGFSIASASLFSTGHNQIYLSERTIGIGNITADYGRLGAWAEM